MKGYVFYLDLLGISHISRIPDYSDILEKKILKFHSIINENIKETKNLEYHLLSDSVFLYTYDNDISSFFVVANIFRDLLKDGILCRAGCDYDEFGILNTVLSEKNILGEAAVKSVELEKSGKGHRIFVSDKAYKSFNNKLKEMLEVIDNLNENSLITKHINYTDYTELYIFNWVYVNDTIFMSNESFYKFDNKIIKLHKVDDTIINDNFLLILNEDNFNHYIYTPTNKSDKKEESKVGKSIINITKKYIENSIKNMESLKIENEPDFNQS